MAIYDIPEGHPSTQTISILVVESTSITPPPPCLSVGHGHVFITLNKVTHIVKVPWAKKEEKKGSGGGKREEWRLADEFMLDAFGPAEDRERRGGGGRA